MTVIKRLLFLTILLSVLISVTGCGGLKKHEKYYFDWFDTVTTVTAYTKTEREFKAILEEVESVFTKYNKLFDIYNSYDAVNNLYTLNSTDEPLSVDGELIDFLEFSKSAHDLTGGEVNIAMGSVLKLWHDCHEMAKLDKNKAELPDRDKLEAAANNTDINNIVIDRQNGTVSLKGGISLDVGAIAKGYAVEKAKERLESLGITSVLINAGGNVTTIGEKPNGKLWGVGIENPDTEDTDNPYIEYLSISDKSVVTSGVYQRYYTVDGKRYHHIIDKDTLMPSEYFLSVSVISDNSGLADALSTALFNTDVETGLLLVESLTDVEAMWVLPSGEIKYSKGFSDYVQK